MLKRYWFVIYPEWRYGALNAGVTAATVEEAKELLLKNFIRIDYSEPLQRLQEQKEVEVIEDIDLQLLDKEHVLPNIGPVIFGFSPCLSPGLVRKQDTAYRATQCPSRTKFGAMEILENQKTT